MYKNIGIFQGRLTQSRVLQSFPENWRKEFFKAKILNFSYIEFFLEENINSKNPFWSKRGRNEIKNLMQEYFHSQTFYLCDNFIIKNNLYDKASKSYLKKVLLNLKDFKKSKLILPLNSHYLNDLQKLQIYLRNILRIKNTNTEISFEIDCDIKKNLDFIKNLNIPNVGITFDIGNIFLKNRSLEKYFLKIYKYVNHIHIKDRSPNGKNVSLGSGLINFKNFFYTLEKKNLKCSITLETYRKYTPITSAFLNLDYIKRLM